VVGDTVRSPELRHEVPLSIPDPFLFAEVDGTGHVVVSALELARVTELPGVVAHPFEEFGYDALLAQGLPIDHVRLEVYANACRELGVAAASVPAEFPLAVAERLREAGVALTVDQDGFADRRRVKNAAELAGIRRAQRAAEAGMRACAGELSRAERRNGSLTVDGEPLTVERVKADMSVAFARHDTTADEYIVAPGAQGAVGHDMGSGPIRPGTPLVVDIFPRDNASAVYTDMTRTFVVGDVPDDVREWHRLVKEALDAAVAEIRAGVEARAVFDLTCEIFEAAGQPTQRTKQPGEALADGFFHGLGHGVGLEVHEAPGLGRLADKKLVAGDVVTVEPGLYRAGYGGVRLEDIVLVTEEGAEVITDYPYDLEA
jgi:Xaa-Pro aminopeptidase